MFDIETKNLWKAVGARILGYAPTDVDLDEEYASALVSYLTGVEGDYYYYKLLDFATRPITPQEGARQIMSPSLMEQADAMMELCIPWNIAWGEVPTGYDDPVENLPAIDHYGVYSMINQLIDKLQSTVQA